MSTAAFVDEEESVYDLIKPPPPKVEKKPLHRSKYPGTLPPSYSTIGTKNTTKPGIANAGGDLLDFDEVGGTHKVKAQTSTFGRKTVKETVKPNEFLKSRTREPKLPEPKKFTYTTEKRKDPVPSKTEKPISGLKSEKNYITANAVDAILAVPKKPKEGDMDYTKKKDYGKTPEYLHRVKQEIDEEKELVRQIQEQQDALQRDQVRLLEEDERLEILGGLKKKWEELNKKYQTLRFSSDTPANYQRKEKLEADLESLEKDIAVMSKKFVYVHDS